MVLGGTSFEFDMRQLEYFVTAASAGSYSKAAKILFVSPQAISKGVQVLESRTGISLFERGPGGIKLTEFGETFYQECTGVLKSMQRLSALVEEYRHERNATFSVGIHSFCFKEHGGSIDWNDLLAFSETHDEAIPSFIEMHGDAIIASVDSGSLDFGISVPPSTDLDAFEGTLLKAFPLAAIVSSENERFASRDTISIEELTQGQLVLLAEEQEFNRCFMRKAEEEGLKVEVSPLQIRTDSDTDFVINKDLYALRPFQHAKRTTKGDRVRILLILDEHGNKVNIPLSLIWKKDREITPLEEAFIAMIVSLYQ